ncbi:hypothetical protein GJ496_001890 [Pomphorhynchus laevis]|nr:hypothetical protein GJ496_001890 [Pomphorhynchus laevis]
MEKICDAILNAKEQIFITDWWLSPEISLIRFKDGNKETWRLDELLAKKADDHVRIYVLLFKEVRFALTIDSLHSKVALRSRNPKFIKVIRHPDHNAGTLLWSHHEKSVVIDQTIAFVGGIDLCFGRWDDNAYRLVDLGNENDRHLLTPSELVTPSLADMMRDRTGNKFAETLLATAVEAEKQPGVRHKENSSGYKDETSTKAHYRNMWREARQNIRKKSYNALEEDSDEELYDPEQVKRTQSEVIMQDRIWIGKDYSNSYLKDFADVKDYYIDSLNRSCEPRMPWHDEASVVLGDAAQDVARHFIQRWNQAKREKHRDNSNYPYLLPKSYPSDPPNDHAFESIYNANVQVLRSVGSWSAGVTIVESSIMNACCHLIESAKHYVLIENQFFITSTLSTDVVKNGIGKAIYERIARAFSSNESFKIYVILPMLPGFDSKQAIQAIQHFTMRSISVGENSIFEKLRNEGGVQNPSDYISFFAMRNWDILMGKLVTEVIYVHSKLMISDDTRAIVGSANINDRSLLGPRDSELALIIEDSEFNEGRMNGNIVKVGKMCSSWRKAIFSEALHSDSFPDLDIEDPACDSFFSEFKRIAKKNTDTYVEVFGCIPNDHIRTFAQLKEWQTRSFLANTNPNDALSVLRKNIQGYIVELPLYFLFEEDYYPLTKTREGLAPYIMWT